MTLNASSACPEGRDYPPQGSELTTCSLERRVTDAAMTLLVLGG